MNFKKIALDDFYLEIINIFIDHLKAIITERKDLFLEEGLLLFSLPVPLSQNKMPPWLAWAVQTALRMFPYINHIGLK